MSLIKLPELDGAGWTCASCDEPLVPMARELEYLDSKFTVELPTCPKCGYVLIPEEIAIGKMFRAEQLMEDK
ncbi:DVU_1557 family redox protein [Pseudodesulfovibrio sp.]|uniref:DVU_1557 family redox protein n=1 Tax=Pseudodesulfovibrio sp. TaxID=2035812 RepID=UPI00261DFFEB|nr:CLJU_RS11820 family redox protein [Pseudodesulfovibrio sp.]MDD3313013.1 DNA-binding protein [Pseudodesulfovibrio sp.]